MERSSPSRSSRRSPSASTTFVWSSHDYSLREFVNLFKHSLPVIVKVKQGHCGYGEDKFTFSSEEIYHVSGIGSQKRFLAKEQTDRLLSIPVDFTTKFHLVEKRKNLPCHSLEHFLTTSQFYPGMRVIPENGSQLNYWKGTDHRQRADISVLELISTFQDQYLVALPVIEGSIVSKPVCIPLFVAVRLVVSEGLIGGTAQQYQWLMDGYNQNAQISLDHAEIRGNTEIMMFDKDHVIRSDVSEYVFLEPITYVSHALIQNSAVRRSLRQNTMEHAHTMGPASKARAKKPLPPLPHDATVSPSGGTTEPELPSAHDHKHKSWSSSNQQPNAPPKGIAQLIRGFQNTEQSGSHSDPIKTIKRSSFKLSSSRNGINVPLRDSTDGQEMQTNKKGINVTPSDKQELRKLPFSNQGGQSNLDNESEKHYEVPVTTKNLSRHVQFPFEPLTPETTERVPLSVPNTPGPDPPTPEDPGDIQPYRCFREIKRPITLPPLNMPEKSQHQEGGKKAVKQVQFVSQESYSELSQVPGSLEGLSKRQVSDCLRLLHMPQFVNDSFLDNDVDGDLLVTLDKDMLTELGMSKLQSQKLYKFIHGWRPKE